MRYAALGLMICIGMFQPATSHAVPYDATADFSIGSNPTGVWTYGYLDVTGATFTPYASASSSWHGNANLDAWSQFAYDSSSYSVVGKNVSGSIQFESPGGSIEVDPGTLFTHPGNSGEKGTIRFTATAAGNYDYTALFKPTDTTAGNRDVHVYVNGVDQIPGSLVLGSKTGGNTISDADTVSLLLGGTIDFAVGYGSDGVYFNDATFLQATVELVPEPGSLALLSFGVASIFVVRRRRSRS